MVGATQNIYTGLHSFDDCGLLLHLLRPSDLCIDIGANVGVYTILSSAAVGAHTVAIEPMPSTYEKLRTNIRYNDVADRTTSYNIGLGSENSTLLFTTNQDVKNRVVSEEYSSAETIRVPVRTLDDVLGDENPTLIKIDVEGWEAQVLAGAKLTLNKSSLLCFIIEMDGSSESFNPSELAVHQAMTSHDFRPYAYDPLTRKLSALASKHVGAANTIYLRNLEEVQERVSTAPPFSSEWSTHLSNLNPSVYSLVSDLKLRATSELDLLRIRPLSSGSQHPEPYVVSDDPAQKIEVLDRYFPGGQSGECPRAILRCR